MKSTGANDECGAARGKGDGVFKCSAIGRKCIKSERISASRGTAGHGSLARIRAWDVLMPAPALYWRAFFVPQSEGEGSYASKTQGAVSTIRERYISSTV